MDVELKQCPFCGGAMRFDSNRDWHKLEGSHEEHCVFDNYEPAIIVPAEDSAKSWAITAWNNRHGAGDAGSPDHETLLRLAQRWERIADEKGVTTFTGNEHRLFANELRAALRSSPISNRVSQLEALLAAIHCMADRTTPAVIRKHIEMDIPALAAIDAARAGERG